MNYKLPKLAIETIESHIPELEKRERALWDACTKIEEEMAPMKKRQSEANREWFEVNRELEALKALCQKTEEA